MMLLIAQAPQIESYTAATLPAWIKAGRIGLDLTPVRNRKAVPQKLRSDRTAPTMADILPSPAIFRPLRLGTGARIKPDEWTPMTNDGGRFFVSKTEVADFDVDRAGRIAAVAWTSYRGKGEARARTTFLARTRGVSRTLGSPVSISRRFYPGPAQSVVRADWLLGRTLVRTTMNRTRTGVFTVRVALNLLRP